MDRVEHAVELMGAGNNCCQATLLAFADELDLTVDEPRALGSAFGYGMGRMEGTCGALVGAEMLLGLKRYAGRPIPRDANTLLTSFKESCGATRCADIKGRDTGVVLTACDD